MLDKLRKGQNTITPVQQLCTHVDQILSQQFYPRIIYFTNSRFIVIFKIEK